ncbi:hypothetical protein CANMA_000162 [Candida margitis]|uniref:uncharacterized protein n=1 Tax=Candida margitis TaxID=1775924 RepID=UPI002227CF6E|nr:uncharacterized protein CANMA_000162 [Candida margitis]KAI5970743.1 hypothetical protein CANMA_000162 [Candida margitis]
MSEEYPPKSIVLAKVKGYPAWPAMVLDVDLLPPHILNKRPKNKQHEPTPNILPIKFFSDDTYIWIKTGDIKPLSKDDIAAHFVQSSQKRRKDTVLDRAFELANDPLDMEIFIKYGSKGEPEFTELDEEQEQEDDDLVVKVPARKKQKVATPKQAKVVDKKTLAEEKKEAERKLLAQYDSDWGLQDFNKYSVTQGNYIFDSLEEQKSVFASIPDIGGFSSLFDKAIDKFRKIEEEVLEQLLSEDVSNTDELCQLLTSFSNLVSKVPRSVITKSRLIRALIVDQRKHSPGDHGQLDFKEKTSKILKRLGIEVRENTEEELEVKSEVSTAQSTPEVIESIQEEEVEVKVEPDTVNFVNSPLKHEVQTNGN